MAAAGDPRRVVLHVGAPKSGTTYVQSRLQVNHRHLLDHGVLVPQGSAEDGPETLMFRAALDLTGIRLHRGRAYTDGRWEQLVAAARDHDGTVLVSDEALVRADDAAAARAVRDLGDDGRTRVDVVYTARDLGRALVSAWLENLKHGGAQRFADFLEQARDGRLKMLRSFRLDVVLGRWAAAVGDPGHVHLVTLPPAGGPRDLLWTRFLRAAGVEESWAPGEARRTNDSVGLPEAQFLRALNEQLDGAAARGGPLHDLVREVVLARALADRRSEPVRLDPAYVDWAAGLTADWVRWVRGSGVDVVGSLDDLAVVPVRPEEWVDPDRPVPEALAAADAALASVRAALASDG